MFCFLAVALFNTVNAGTIVDGGPPPFWIVLIVNPLLCIYGIVNNKIEPLNTIIIKLMPKSYWLINSNRTEVKDLQKMIRVLMEFWYMFVDTGK